MERYVRKATAEDLPHREWTEVLAKAGFHYCGIIHLLDGDERLAYLKIIDSH